MDNPNRVPAPTPGELLITASLISATGGIAGPSEELRALRMIAERNARKLLEIRALIDPGPFA